VTIAALVDDVPKLLLAAFLSVLASASVWIALAGGTGGTRLARVWSRRATRLLTALVALALFGAIAEDTLFHERDELVLVVDHHARDAARQLGELPPIHDLAKLTSRLTGEGLLVLVVAAVITLAARQRRREAWAVAGGTLGAWLASGLLKVAFGIPRPRAHLVPGIQPHAGFPSGHAFVTLVACGLTAWALGCAAAPRHRVALLVLAALVAAASGASRLVLDAHWLSDVVAGLALGAAWLGVMLAFADGGPRTGPISPGAAPRGARGEIRTA
jgi:undecaprenyl-diphosphatase